MKGGKTEEREREGRSTENTDCTEWESVGEAADRELFFLFVLLNALLYGHPFIDMDHFQDGMRG